MRERTDLLPGMEKEPEYRPIMRRLPPAPPPVRDVWAEQVLWEYWNGRVWLPIPGTEAYAGSFSIQERGAALVEAQFRWPADAAPCEEGGQTEETFHLLENPRLPLLQPVTPEGSCWWLGFDRPPSGLLMRLYLSLLNRVPGGQLSAWEIAEDGRECPLTLEDGTEGLSHSSVMTLNGIQGQWSVRFGLRRWWLCLRDDAGQLSQGRQFPRLMELACGAVCLQTDSGEWCQKDETLSPLRGGTLHAVTLTKGFGGAAAEDQIRRLLERDSVLPALGFSIAVREPAFYPVSAMVWLRPAEGIPVEAVRHRVCDALDRFLHPAAGHFQGQGWRIGSLPSEMEARNYLQTYLQNFSIVKLLLTAAAPDGRELDCAQVEDPYALPLPGPHTVHLMQKEGSLCTR